MNNIKENMNKQICVCVPLYKKIDNKDFIISDSEKLSLSTLAKYCDEDIAIKFVCPYSWLPDDVEEWRQCLGDRVVFVDQFDDECFKSTHSYSYLLSSTEFWDKFPEYDYVCIYQTDCIAFEKFSETLKKLAEEDWDYVGAPIMTNLRHWPSAPTCGNGGFSLRKVDKMLEIFENKDLLNKLRESNKSYDLYEDVLICEGVTQYFYIDKPNWQDAARFAFDMNPDVVYQRMENKLPLAGCHAFGKNIPFWSRVLPKLFSDSIIRNEYNKNKTFIDIYFGEDFGKLLNNKIEVKDFIMNTAEVWRPDA